MTQSEESNNELPKVRPHQWISIGENGNVDAVVVKEYENKYQGDIKVIYISQKGKPIMEPASWNGEYWEFYFKGPMGTRVKKTGRYSSFINQAQKGRY